ncbi:MAG: hypothetical protein JWQ01_2195 [Massilia sp.]|nr:hypothetical protein [Massilia sp.]
MAQTINSNVFSVMVTPPRVPGVLPDWVPPAGYFADVPMRNNPQDVTPAIFKGDYFGADSPFVMWGGSAILRDYSALGAQVYYSGGHEAAVGLPNMQFSLICDFSTLLWSTANVPVKANPSTVFDQTNGMAPDGTPYTPHTYLGLQEVPAAWGGGKRGSLASFFWGGSVLPNKINVLDVSALTHGYTQMKTIQPQNADPTQIRFSRGAGGGNYPITVMDDTRQGWWAATNGSVEYNLFISKTGEIRQYQALGGNLASGALVLCPSLNLLIAVDGGYASGSGPRSLHLRDLNSGTVTRSATLGPVPSLTNGYDGSINTFHMPDMLGLQWVEELRCIVGIDQTVSPPVIVKLTPPASNPATGSWTWSTVTVQHWPKDAGGQAELQVARNGVWSKFRWVPSLQAFVYGTAQNRKPQVIKLN